MPGRPGMGYVAVDTIRVTDARVLQDVSVEVDITHSWRGDLVVELTGPGGDTVVLHNREGGSADHIQRAYSVADTPGLSAFFNQSANGDWSLKAADRDRFIAGKLAKDPDLELGVVRK